MATFLDSFSKSTVEAALHTSEVLLLVSGLVLLIGIWGEYRKGERWKKYLAVFQVMVLAGIGVELLADAGVFLFSESLQKLEGADIQALDRKTRDARDRAADALGKSMTAVDKSETANSTSKGALGKSGKAERSATSALDLAKGARQEADSFEKDIVSAKEQAASAESHLAEALKRATEATAALDRIKTPRMLTHIQELISALGVFKDTEYTFSSVFADEESIRLLKTIDDVLQRAGWKRTDPPKGFPSINIYGNDNFAVTAALTDGIRISVDSPQELSALSSLPIDKLPPPVNASVSLDLALSSALFPPENLPSPYPVNIVKGESKTVRISVGKKP